MKRTTQTCAPRRRLLALATLILSLSSCATSYGAKGLFGGFEEMRIDDSTMKVHFQGNGYTSKQTVETYTLLRCAELTQQSGFDWFLVLNGDTEIEDTQVNSGGVNYSHQSGVAGVNSLGNVNYGSSTYGWTSPTTTFNIRKYDSAVMIKMFHGEKPQEAHNGFVAAEVVANLGPQVKR